MKKGLILLAFSLLAVGFAIVGCSKSSDVTLKDADQITVLDRDCGGFSDGEVASIGSTHNSMVTSLYANFDFDAPDENAELVANLASAFPGLTDAQIQNIINNSRAASGFDINRHAGQITNDLVYTYFATLKNIIDESSSMTELRNELNDLKGLVLANLTCSDRNFLLAAIQVTANSADLWSPVSFGGQGYYDYLNNIRGSQGEVSSRWTWKGVLEGDMIGASEAFFAYGIGLAIPGTNAAIAGEIAFMAGFHSAASFLH